MKKTLSLLLALLMLASVFTGCGDNGKGAVIPVYISDEIVNLDPAFAYDNETSLKILPLLYEGLTVVNKKGKVEKALMDDYKYEQQEDGTYMMEVTLKESYWSDGITVSANDFVYAYKRILDPETDCSAAALLYDLKNARDVKSGKISIDDLGVCAAEKGVIQFIFDKDIDVDMWLETLASPALVPLRESAVATQAPSRVTYIENEDGQRELQVPDIPVYGWSSDPSILVTNGKFCIKKLTVSGRNNGEMIIERNAYYRRDPLGDEKLDKYVKTYRLKIVFPSDGEQAEYNVGTNEQAVSLKQLAAYADFDAEDKGSAIVFDSDISMVNDVEKAETLDMLCQHVYYFNTKNELFADARVRQALSMAIDREAITEIVGYTAASEGLVVNGVYADSKRKETYREKFGSLIDSSADMDEAKSLLKAAGATGGSFKISCRNSDVDVAIAEYVADVWGDLGYKVTVQKMKITNDGINGTDYVKQYSLYRDELSNALIYGEFDVIAIDYTALSTYAFASLAPFASTFSGRAIDLRLSNTVENYDTSIPHVTGWENAEYDELIEKAFAESDLAKRSEILYEAEEILMEEMPVMPLVRYQNAYVKSKALSKLDSSYYGTVLFDEAKLKNAEDYAVESTEATN
ncbi:MAG: hypothetical protein IJ519_03335 [Clostridia bacterium]|nr:hypothetical protein [Clostridia bacterium]